MNNDKTCYSCKHLGCESWDTGCLITNESRSIHDKACEKYEELEGVDKDKLTKEDKNE